MTSPARSKRLLAVVHEPRSVAPMQLAASASERWDLLWILDERVSHGAENLALLRRFGKVVDVTGMSLDQRADAVAAFDPAGIVAYADDELMGAALIAQHIGLAHNSPAVVRRLTDKHAQRCALKLAGVEVPGFWVLPHAPSADALAKVLAEVRFPAVFKPRFGNGSRNTVRVDGAARLRAELAEAGRHHLSRGPSIEERAIEHGESEFVIEEYLPDGVPRENQVFADYVSVETAVVAGELRHLAVTGCFPLADPFRESGNFLPCALSAGQSEAVQAAASAAIAALDVTSGILHTEIKLTPAGPRVIEVNGRIGGDVPDLVRLAAGRDMFEVSARIALFGQLPEDTPVRCERVAYILNVQPPKQATSINSISGLAEVARFPGVEAVKLNRRPGDRLDWREGTSGYLYSVLGTALDHDAMLRSRAEVLETMAVSFES